MANRIHRALKIIAFNASGIWMQCHELRKQLQDLRIDVALFAETYLKPCEWFLFQITTLSNWLTLGKEGGTAVAVRKVIPRTQADLPPLVSVEATGVCIPAVKGQYYGTCSCLWISMSYVEWHRYHSAIEI
jgi:hypothetical protein